MKEGGLYKVGQGKRALIDWLTRWDSLRPAIAVRLIENVWSMGSALAIPSSKKRLNHCEQAYNPQASLSGLTGLACLQPLYSYWILSQEKEFFLDWNS